MLKTGQHKKNNCLLEEGKNKRFKKKKKKKKKRKKSISASQTIPSHFAVHTQDEKRATSCLPRQCSLNEFNLFSLIPHKNQKDGEVGACYNWPWQTGDKLDHKSTLKISTPRFIQHLKTGPKRRCNFSCWQTRPRPLVLSLTAGVSFNHPLVGSKLASSCFLSSHLDSHELIANTGR